MPIEFINYHRIKKETDIPASIRFFEDYGYGEWIVKSAEVSYDNNYFLLRFENGCTHRWKYNGKEYYLEKFWKN